MFCPNCGNQVEDGTAFCPMCGTNLKADEAPKMTPPTGAGAQQETRQAQGATPFQQTPPPVWNQAAAVPKKTLPIKLIAIAAVALVAVIVLAVLISNRRTPVKLDKYVEVEYNGYNGYGTAIASFDQEKFYEDYKGKIKLTSKGKNMRKTARKENEELARIFGEAASNETILYYDLTSAVSGELDQRTELSNGDKITWTWEVDEDAEEELESYFKVRLVNSDITFTVEGLEDIEVFDPFDGVEVSFSGVSPDGRAEVNANPRDSAAKNLYYELDRRDGLTNGDTVTLTVTAYSGNDIYEYCAEHYGKVPSATEKAYTCEGLSGYVLSASEIPEDMLQKMKKQAEDAFYAYVAKEWESDTAGLSDFTYIGNYFMSKKPGASGYGDQNLIYLIYKGEAKLDYENNNGDQYHELKTFYYFVGFKNLMLLPDGTCSVDLSSYSKPSDSFTVDSSVNAGWWSTKTWRIYGYEQLDTMFNKLVTQNIDIYEYENNVSE